MNGKSVLNNYEKIPYKTNIDFPVFLSYFLADNKETNQFYQPKVQSNCGSLDVLPKIALYESLVNVQYIIQYYKNSYVHISATNSEHCHWLPRLVQ